VKRYVALLRAINVGGHVVKMEALRALFAELGLERVETFIASGNVIFDSAARDVAALERKIEAKLRESLGYEVTTFLRSTAELAAVAAYRPFPAADMDAEGNSLYIGFLQAPLDDEARRRLLALRTELDEFHAHGREFYWLCRTRFSDSVVTGPMLNRALGVPTTTRNATTVRKLAAKYPEDS
jgi:uncharacterized protein (DUF1697 family)